LTAFFRANPNKQRDIRPKMESMLAADVQLKEFAQRVCVCVHWAEHFVFVISHLYANPINLEFGNLLMFFILG